MSDSGNSEGSRVQPAPVPEDWHGQMLKRKRKIKREAYHLQEEVGLIKANEILNTEKYTFTQQEVLVFFETVLTVPDVLDAWEYQIRFFRENPEGELPEDEQKKWGGRTADFIDWWVCTRYDLNAHNIWNLASVYNSICYAALEAYFLSGDIAKAYEITEGRYNERMSSLGDQK